MLPGGDTLSFAPHQELEKERQEKAEAREKAAELWGRLSQIQTSLPETGEKSPGKPQGKGKP